VGRRGKRSPEGLRHSDGAAAAPSGRGARVLKWVGAITAIISLVLGARQLITWGGDVLHRRREAAAQIELARQQASRDAFADAWASLDRAATLQPGEAVEQARVDVAFAWLQESRPGPGKPFTTITDVVTPVLDRALLTATGSQRADLLAHLGWVTFLRSRDGVPGDPAARYREALAVDAGNAYANAMIGHWLMWTGSNVDEARRHFETALSSAGDRRPFVRSLQLSALANRGESADADLIRVADEMRQRSEPIDPPAADRVYRAFLFSFRPHVAQAFEKVEIAPANLEATYEWVVKVSTSAARSGEVDTIRQRLKARR
jgi:hypothetical protein